MRSVIAILCFAFLFPLAAALAATDTLDIYVLGKTSVSPNPSSRRSICGEQARCISSGSVAGRCRITVPAAESMTTRMSRMTRVLMAARVCQIFVCQIFRASEWTLEAIFLPFFAGRRHVSRHRRASSEVIEIAGDAGVGRRHDTSSV